MYVRFRSRWQKKERQQRKTGEEKQGKGRERRAISGVEDRVKAAVVQYEELVEAGQVLQLRLMDS